ncbi:hypothetical protein CFP56_017615 [Quercus suber]|uniref:Uncharacterized protein n=1 Tax=Quercus suber TaxID=58331 RepID=A0AAW0KJN3_QUESU
MYIISELFEDFSGSLLKHLIHEQLTLSNLKEYVKKKGLPKGLTLGSCSILETVGQGALASLYQTLQSAIGGKDSESSTSGKIIWKLPIIPADGDISHTRQFDWD